MTKHSRMRLLRVYEAMLRQLRDGGALTRAGLSRRIVKDPAVASSNVDEIYTLVCLGLKIYVNDFWEDRGTGKVRLTQSALTREQQKQRPVGTTAVAMTAAAIEEQEETWAQ